jgi:hypothetical protein
VHTLEPTRRKEDSGGRNAGIPAKERFWIEPPRRTGHLNSQEARAAKKGMER